MSQRGVLTSITRHGLNRGEFGPIRKATFEETVDIFLEAGVFAEKDELKGISENILLGKLTKIGTGSFDLLANVEAFVNVNNNMDNDMKFDANQTPVVPYTPGYGNMNNIQMSAYDNSARFTPGSFYKNTFISSPEQGKNAPSSQDYNPQSDYYKAPAPYSPTANDDGNRGQSQYGISAFSPTIVQQTDNKGIISTYSPTTPGYLRPSSNSPQYIQGSGSGLYNSTPQVQGSGNTSSYQPASPGYYPTNPSYNLKAINNASPFYNQDKNDDDEEEEEEEEEENNDEDDKNKN